ERPKTASERPAGHELNLDIRPLLEEQAMCRFLVCALLAGFSLTVVALPATAQKQLKVAKQWSGSVEDEKAPKPEVITSAKGLEAVWKAWKVEGDVPTVDFSKDLVVGVYTVGSRLNLAGARLDDQGNLEVLGIATRDLRPGFRYVLGVVS